MTTIYHIYALFEYVFNCYKHIFLFTIQLLSDFTFSLANDFTTFAIFNGVVFIILFIINIKVVRFFLKNKKSFGYFLVFQYPPEFLLLLVSCLYVVVIIIFMITFAYVQ